MKTRLIMSILVFVLMALALVHLSSPLRPGKLLESEGILSEFMKGQGYVTMGSWGDASWPATITGIESGKDGIVFTIGQGQKNVYSDPAYVGCIFKLVRLKGKDEKGFDRLFKTSEKK